VYQSLSHVNDEGRRALLQAGFLGDKNPIPPELEATFRNAGITHLLAISGQNVAIIAGAIVALLYFVPLPRRTKVLITIGGLWWFLFVIGVIPSLFRSVVMATTILAGLLLQRRGHPLNALGLAGCIWLCLSPRSLVTAGFQLSFAATFGILAVFPWLEKTVSKFLPGDHEEGISRPRIGDLLTLRASPAVAAGIWTIDALLLSMATFVTTLPVLVCQFGTVSTISIAVNLIAVSLMSCAMWSLVMAIALQRLIEPLAALFARLADLLLGWLIEVARLALHVPFSVVQVVPPHPAVTIAAVGFLIGLVTVKREGLRRYLAFATPAVVLAVVATTAADRIGARPAIHEVSAPAGRMTVITCAGRNAWIVASLSDTLGARFYNDQLLPLLRIQRTGGIGTAIVGGGAVGTPAATAEFARNTHPQEIYVAGTLDVPGAGAGADGHPSIKRLPDHGEMAIGTGMTLTTEIDSRTNERVLGFNWKGKEVARAFLQ
jgi:competence protein ComEC